MFLSTKKTTIKNKQKQQLLLKRQIIVQLNLTFSMRMEKSWAEPSSLAL
ncbi:hypothetical protein EsVE80_01280 [Enterococcus saigonensis]|uniref:Uncharacterized protein n=1 Tax=Enterococcus saigonensis TaxID=1805431 RepID=A0A679IHA6_9ENTE|nr:hypothetical protein EsVE80_01280 [Enterococcus saigonensis]